MKINAQVSSGGVSPSFKGINYDYDVLSCCAREQRKEQYDRFRLKLEKEKTTLIEEVREKDNLIYRTLKNYLKKQLAMLRT